MIGDTTSVAGGSCRTCGQDTLVQVRTNGEITRTYHDWTSDPCDAMIKREYTPGGRTWTSGDVPHDQFIANKDGETFYDD